MDEYGKVFRCKSDNTFILRTYDPENHKYYELIKSAKEDGYNQLIVNSELMIDLIYTTLQKNGLLLKITMSDNTDNDVKDNVNYIVRKLRQDRLIFTELKAELEWASDSGSIDIDSIDVFFESIRYTIMSNGIIYGQKISEYFNQVFKPVLGRYFNV